MGGMARGWIMECGELMNGAAVVCIFGKVQYGKILNFRVAKARRPVVGVCETLSSCAVAHSRSVNVPQWELEKETSMQSTP